MENGEERRRDWTEDRQQIQIIPTTTCCAIEYRSWVKEQNGLHRGVQCNVTGLKHAQMRR